MENDITQATVRWQIAIQLDLIRLNFRKNELDQFVPSQPQMYSQLRARVTFSSEWREFSEIWPVACCCILLTRWTTVSELTSRMQSAVEQKLVMSTVVSNPSLLSLSEAWIRTTFWRFNYCAVVCMVNINNITIHLSVLWAFSFRGALNFFLCITLRSSGVYNTLPPMNLTLE